MRDRERERVSEVYWQIKNTVVCKIQTQKQWALYIGESGMVMLVCSFDMV